MILLSTSLRKKLLITYLSSICLTWKSVSQRRFNISSQDALHHVLLDRLSLICQICPLSEMRGSCAAERDEKDTSTARTLGQKGEEKP